MGYFEPVVPGMLPLVSNTFRNRHMQHTNPSILCYFHRHLQMSDVLMELFADHEKRLGEHIDSKISLSLDDNGLELFTDTEHSESTNFDQGRGVTVLEWITNTDASSNDTPMLLVEKSIATEMESTEPIPFYSSDHICLPDSFGAIQDRHNVVPEWAMNWAASVVEEKKRDIRSEIGHASVEETTKKVVTLRDDYHYQSSH